MYDLAFIIYLHIIVLTERFSILNKTQTKKDMKVLSLNIGWYLTYNFTFAQKFGFSY